MSRDTQCFRLSRQGLMLAMISAAFAGDAWAETAARVDFAVGSVTATGQDGRSRALSKGAEVLAGDRIETTAGRAQLRFTDGAYVSLQPNTTFEVRQYRFTGKTDGTERGVFGLLRGAFRTVTGLIGRVNRGAYEIQTPTATVGIRGTGGVIQLLADGTLRVTGNSGTWFIRKPNRKDLDVPAGTVGEASPNPNEDPQETTEQPVLPPPQPIQVAGVESIPPTSGPATFLAGEQVNQFGQPLLTGGLQSGSGYDIAFVHFDPSGVGMPPVVDSATATFDASGRLVQFIDSAGTKTLSGSHNTFATDGTTWALGQWVGPADLGNAGIVNYPPGQGLHYVTGLPAPSLPGGTFSYGMVAATPAADGTSLGSFSGTLVGNFSTMKVDVTGTANVGGFTYGFQSVTGGLSINGTRFGSISPTELITSGTGCFSGCIADVKGAFFGANASHAGFAYLIDASGGTGKKVGGAAAFQK